MPLVCLGWVCSVMNIYADSIVYVQYLIFLIFSRVVRLILSCIELDLKIKLTKNSFAQPALPLLFNHMLITIGLTRARHSGRWCSRPSLSTVRSPL